MFHVDRWTGMTKLTVAIHNFVNVPKSAYAIWSGDMPGRRTVTGSFGGGGGISGSISSSSSSSSSRVVLAPLIKLFI